MIRRDMINQRLNANPNCIIIRKNINNKECAKISGEETDYICSVVDCPNIKEIFLNNYDLSPNSIRAAGMLHISRKRWDRLTFINLGENHTIKATTILWTKDANS